MKRVAVCLIVFLAVAGSFFAWWQLSLQPVDSSNHTTKTFVVAKGDGIKEISKNLKSAGLIRDQVAFFLLERIFVKNAPQAGNFSLSPSLSASEIATKLTIGTQDIWITIPEGWRSEQILEYLGKTGDWKADEGKYFPETYLIPQTMALEDIRQLMLSTYAKKTAGLKVDTKTLIIASLVEREAKKAADRPLIASVIYNRLEVGVSLDIDATVQYALGKPGSWWRQDLSLDDLKTKSPYNTYINVGLPPAPICNPGLASIQAALSPAQTNYLYYVADKTGTTHFAKTLQEHNANVAKYL